MDKLTIGQLARKTGLRTSALRYYEDQGLLAPSARTEAGYRLYEPEAEQTVHFIQRAQHLGLTLADIKVLLHGWQNKALNEQAVLDIARTRYFELEAQVTQLQVLQRELGFFLQDIQSQAMTETNSASSMLLTRLLDQICSNPLNQPVETFFDWLSESTGCILTTDEGQAILNKLRGQHAHIWQEGDSYHILVISDDPAVEQALQDLAQLEANCHAHAHAHQMPELLHNDEGYLLIAQGSNAFIFARLFLLLEKESQTP